MLFGCDYHIIRDLEQVEKIVEGSPDSALNILSGIDTARLSSEKAKSMYVYLASLGKYKAYIDESDYKPIAKSAAYFRRHDDKQRCMKSLYLGGYTLLNQEDYKRAVAFLTEAESLAETLEDNYYAGLCCRELASAFDLSFSSMDAYEYSKKAYDYFTRARKTEHAKYMLLHIGRAMNQLGRHEEALSFYPPLIEQAKAEKDTLYQALATRDYALTLLSAPNPDGAYIASLFSSVYHTFKYTPECTFWSDWGYALALSGDKKGADQCFGNARNSISKSFDEYYLYYRSFQGASKLGDSIKAVDSIQKALDILDKSVTQSREEAISAQRNYYLQKEQTTNLKRALEQQTFLIYITILVVTIIILILCVIIVKIHIDTIQQEKAFLISQIKLLSKEHSLHLKLAAQTGMRALDTLAQYNWQNQDEKIAPELSNILTNLASNEEVKTYLINVVNRTRNDLMVRLSSSVPSLNANEIMLYCYLVNGIGHNTLCNFLHKTSAALNAQTYRLRKKIEQSDAVDKAEFLDAIG